MNVIFFPFHKRRKPSPTQLRQRQQLEELREVKRRLDAARCFFQAVSDHDLVAASVCDLKRLGRDRVHVTVGSALDLFGGGMKFEEVLQECRKGRRFHSNPAAIKHP